MEVIYTGLHQTPEMIATAAVQEDVDVVGLSILSGAHMTLFPRVIDLLREQGRDDVLVTGGGIIPKEDMDKLRALGVGRPVRAGHVDERARRLHQARGSPSASRPRSRRRRLRRRRSVRRDDRAAAPPPVAPSRPPRRNRLRQLGAEVRALEERLRQGGGPDKIDRQHKQGKLTARERVARLCDAGTPFLEVGLLVAYDEYDGQAPGAGVVTGLGVVHGRDVVVVANDATVKAGSWWPETIKKILRAQEIAMRCRVPIVYLVDSAGVNLPYQGGVFPGQYGAARIFYYNSIMRRYLRVPQLAAVMGPCIAGGAYLPALSDVIVMTEGTSFMGLGGANLVKGATGQTTDNETLGGAATHTRISGVAHYMADDDDAALAKLRELVDRLPAPRAVATREGRPPARPEASLYEVLPSDHRMSYDMHDVLRAVVDAGELDEFQRDLAKEIVCGDARVDGIAVGVIANQRGLIKGAPASAAVRRHPVRREREKVAYFIDRCDRQGIPLLFVQDVSGFMVGPGAEHEGIIRSGARFVEAMATARVPEDRAHREPRLGRRATTRWRAGLRPRLHLLVADGRMGVMEGESAVQAVHGPAIERARKAGAPAPPDVQAPWTRCAPTTSTSSTRASPPRAASSTRSSTPRRRARRSPPRSAPRSRTPGPHLGAFGLPAGV
jgi:methylmalonyl-CoA mutase cobalamin-binding domain/chain